MSKILLVEDDPLISNIYQMSLRRAGYDIEVIASGSGVVNKIKENDYDLLLLDLVLPEKSGFEVLEEIHRGGIDEDLKIIVLSNLGQKEKVERALEMGAEEYLIKAHFTPKEVVAKIRDVMES